MNQVFTNSEEETFYLFSKIAKEFDPSWNHSRQTPEPKIDTDL